MKINFKALLNQFCSLDFNEEEAQDHWYQILRHRKHLEKTLERPINFAVALADYVSSCLKTSESLFIVDKDQYHQTKNSAIRDPLTSLYHQGFLKDYLERELGKAKRCKTILSILFLDIDHFKELNDRYGHETGNSVLQKIAEILMRSSRKADVVARYGGEEFVIVMSQTSGKTAMNVAQRLRHSIETHQFRISNSSEKVQITVSGGVATYPSDALEGEVLLNQADQALYLAKSRGRNRIFTSNYSKQYQNYKKEISI
jgi:diguanylate cyclase (GGDEF)-like protein